LQPEQSMRRPLSRRALLATPLAVTAAGGVGFLVLLERMRRGTYNPQGFNNPLVGHKIPGFTLAGADGHKGFGSGQLAAQSRPVLVNFFASWCVPCIAESPYLADIAKAGLDIWGIAYEDKAPDLAKFLVKYGNPFRHLATDPSGRTAINWGVYGVPESFLIAPGGIVHWHIAQPLTPDSINNQLRPALKSLA
jgi:cytochrome c biogenesis protein CcmG/thiol:disulfide interchange protein DsbE